MRRALWTASLLRRIKTTGELLISKDLTIEGIPSDLQGGIAVGA
jgi:hypothetical protein